jgi:hypothetical protein
MTPSVHRKVRGRVAVVAAGIAASVSLALATEVFAADKPAASAAGAGAPSASQAAHPDFSGYWMLATTRVAPDQALLDKVPPGTAMLDDTGAKEFPKGEYGGLKLKPKAREIAAAWNEKDDMSLTNACKPPSIVYAMQGPFPIEIHQGTELIVIRLEYFDMVRVIFMDGREPDENTPASKVGFSKGRWEGDTLVVETTHLSPATITNNGLFHSDKVKVLERFRLAEDGKALVATQEFEDPEMLENRGARFIAWRKRPGEHVYPYECDPTFALEYQNQK